MRIWAKGQWYDGEQELIVVELSDQDKKNIKNMPDTAKFYSMYPPKNYTQKEVVDILQKLRGGK